MTCRIVQQNYVKKKEALDARINEITDKLQRKETIRSKHELVKRLRFVISNNRIINY